MQKEHDELPELFTLKQTKQDQMKIAYENSKLKIKELEKKSSKLLLQAD